MKSVKGFWETRNHKTAVAVWADDPGGYFLTKITHNEGAQLRHPVFFHTQLSHIFEEARIFLDSKGQDETNPNTPKTY